MASNNECPICLNNFDDKAHVEDCQHNFCFKCITTWTEKNTKCPMCKREIIQILHNIRGDSNYEIYDIKIGRDNANGINNNDPGPALNNEAVPAIRDELDFNDDEILVTDDHLLDEENEWFLRDLDTMEQECNLMPTVGESSHPVVLPEDDAQLTEDEIAIIERITLEDAQAKSLWDINSGSSFYNEGELLSFEEMLLLGLTDEKFPDDDNGKNDIDDANLPKNNPCRNMDSERDINSITGRLTHNERDRELIEKFINDYLNQLKPKDSSMLLLSESSSDTCSICSEGARSLKFETWPEFTHEEIKNLASIEDVIMYLRKLAKEVAKLFTDQHIQAFINVLSDGNVQIY